MSISPGTIVVNTYRIERPLASGGLGEVFLATHVQLGTQHAVKVIRAQSFEDPRIHDLFRREASVLRGIRNDAVVIYDGFFQDEHSRDYLVMEYVEGPSLADVLRTGPLSIEQVYTLRDRLAFGLAEAHAKGVVHRDISPENIILPDGRVEDAKLIDFGIAKLIQPKAETIIGDSFAGRYDYASPEQLGLLRVSVDARSDIYSLALLLAATATGRPLDTRASLEGLSRGKREVPDLSAVPRPLRTQLTAMLQPYPDDRPPDLMDILRRWPAPATRGTTRLASGSSAAAGETITPREIEHRPPVPFRRLVAMGAAILVPIAILLYFYGPWPEEAFEETGPTGVTIEPTPVPTPSPLSIEAIAQRPWTEVERYFHEFVSRGHVDQAFALLREADRQGHALPSAETHAFARELLSHERTDEAFALFRQLGAAGHGPSALAVGEMYDPQLWNEEHSPFSQPNPRQAERWYKRALDQGTDGARRRLTMLEAWKRQQEETADAPP